jgi:hypothetical protein
MKTAIPFLNRDEMLVIMTSAKLTAALIALCACLAPLHAVELPADDEVERDARRIDRKLAGSERRDPLHHERGRSHAFGNPPQRWRASEDALNHKLDPNCQGFTEMPKTQ